MSENLSQEHNEIELTTEEFLGPPKVDAMGFGLVAIMSVVIGFLGGVAVLLLAYLTSGQFSMQSGVSPILLAMITFFCLTLTDYLYIWGISIIFPHLYVRARTMFMQVSVFSIILYIAMSGLYLIVNITSFSSTAILSAYTFHVVFNIFGLLLITGIITQYRYALLSFYSSFISLVLTGLILFFMNRALSVSGNSLFILMGLIAVSFFLTSVIHFGSYFFYYQMYRNSGYDPIGNIFGEIEKEEKELEKKAENILLSK